MRSSRRERNERRRQQVEARYRLRELDFVVDEQPIPSSTEAFLTSSREVIQAYWDQWLDRPIEQYVACDFEYVWHGLQALKRSGLANGTSFVEWGCGFGVVTGLAWLTDYSAVGIEAEEFLVDEGRKLLKKHHIGAELWHGNFLPSSAESIADRQADHPCLHHPVPAAYAEHECELSDFAVVFAYPWPGEEHYQREVFLTFAGEGTLLFMFRGPYQIELFRKEPM